MSTTVHDTVTFPDGSVATRETETVLYYVNAYGHEMRLDLDPDTEHGQANYKWRAYHPRYKNVRWETRTVTRTVEPWQPVGAQS